MGLKNAIFSITYIILEWFLAHATWIYYYQRCLENQHNYENICVTQSIIKQIGSRVKMVTLFEIPKFEVTVIRTGSQEIIIEWVEIHIRNEL